MPVTIAATPIFRRSCFSGGCATTNAYRAAMPPTKTVMPAYPKVPAMNAFKPMRMAIAGAMKVMMTPASADAS
jgi:hypothetical protein